MELDQDKAKKKFDIIVHHRDPKTGLVVKSDPYILRVCGETGSSEKARYWERPSGSGNLFDKNNNPVGRWVYEERNVRGKMVRSGKFSPGAEHIAFVRPLTDDQKLANAVMETETANAALRAEIAALKAEQEKKTAPTTGPITKKTEPGA